MVPARGVDLELPVSTRFYWVLRGSTRFCGVLLGSAGFYWVLQGSIRICKVPQGSPSSAVCFSASFNDGHHAGAGAAVRSADNGAPEICSAGRRTAGPWCPRETRVRHAGVADG